MQFFSGICNNQLKIISKNTCKMFFLKFKTFNNIIENFPYEKVNFIDFFLFNYLIK